MLATLGQNEPSDALSLFWPKGEPQWDALGVLTDDGVVRIEAKSRLAEFASSGMAAVRASRARIDNALKLVRDMLGVKQNVDWAERCYQYTN